MYRYDINDCDWLAWRAKCGASREIRDLKTGRQDALSLNPPSSL